MNRSGVRQRIGGRGNQTIGTWFDNTTVNISGVAPSFYADFINQRYALSGAEVPFATMFSFARATSGTYVDSAGVIQTAASGAARFDYNPITFAAKGLLIEPTKTNVLLRSAEFDNASWTKTDITITADNTNAPSNAAVADLITEGTLGTASILQAGTVTSGAISTFSVFIKRSSGANWVRVTLFDGAVNGVVVWFNTATGALGTTTALGTAANTQAKIESYPFAGFWRLQLTCSIAATTVYYCSISSASADASFTAVNNSAYWLWGAQLEEGNFATSVIITTTATVARNADVCQNTNFGTWGSSTQGTVFTNGSINGVSKIEPQRFVTISNNNTTNAVLQYSEQTTSIATSNLSSGGVSQYSATFAGAIAAGVSCKMAQTYAVNSFNSAKDGVAGTRDTSGSAPVGLSQIDVGRRHTSVQLLNGCMSDVRWYNTNASDAEMVRITA